MRSFKEEWADIKAIYESEEFGRECKKMQAVFTSAPVVLYGAGILGVEIGKALKFCKTAPIYFCDKNKLGIEENTGLPIISPGMLSYDPIYQDAHVLISSFAYDDEIKSDLAKMGIEKNRILSRGYFFFLFFYFCRYIHAPGADGASENLRLDYFVSRMADIYKMFAGENDKSLSGYERTYDLVADMKSKSVLLNLLKIGLTKRTVTHDLPKCQYFDDELILPLLNDAEVFVDIGAFTGDTAEIFFDHVKNKYAHYYAFEPDKENSEKALALFANKRDVTFEKKGVYSKTTVIGFNGAHTSSSGISEESGYYIEVVSLDEYFNGKPHVPTFIKMDIEGAEAEALKGCERLIREHKPKLAVCVYHKPGDIYELPELIQSFRGGDYKFYLRHYSDSFNETVLYAV